jgi:predicted dehydrogenase
MRSILIIGNGKWANKILNFVEKSKIFNLIYIKTRNENFILKNKKKIKINNLPYYKKVDVIHVCSPIKTHYKYTKNLLGHKNLIIEKPFLNNFRQFQKIKKKLIYLKMQKWL